MQKRPCRLCDMFRVETAFIAVDGAPVELILSSTRGGGDFGIFETQTFVSEAEYGAVVDINFGPSFDGGSYLERGVISVKSPNGWEVVAPAAGIAGCRSK